MMATMTIRNLDEGLKRRLRLRAASHGRSMEDEVRDILKIALSADAGQPTNLAQSIRNRLAPLGGIELDLPSRDPIRTVPGFE